MGGREEGAIQVEMRILLLTHNYEDWGTYFRCFFLGKYLARIGCQVTILCASKKRFDLRIRRKTLAENLKVITLPRIRFHEYHTGHSVRAILNSFIVSLSNFDILHSFTVAQPTSALPTVVYKVLRRKPIVVDWDDDWGEGLAKFHPLPIRKTLIFLEKNVPRVAQKITVVSDYLKNKAIGYGYDKRDVVKITNGANVEAIRPMNKERAREYLGLKKNHPIIVSVGHAYMGTHYMPFEVFSKVLVKRPEARLYLVGSFGLSEEVKKRYKKLLKNIILTGEVPFKEIPYYLASADVLMLPMGDSPIERARWPIRFGDYLASGRPIVSNAVGEVKSIIEKEECGLTSSPTDLESFVQSILEVLDNPEMQERLGARAREVAEEKYSWEKITTDLKNLYEEIL